jgi:hypothetical protein
VADIKKGGGIAGCSVLVNNTGVLNGHGPAPEVNYFGFQSNVFFI